MLNCSCWLIPRNPCHGVAPRWRRSWSKQRVLILLALWDSLFDSTTILFIWLYFETAFWLCSSSILFISLYFETAFWLCSPTILLHFEATYLTLLSNFSTLFRTDMINIFGLHISDTLEFNEYSFSVARETKTKNWKQEIKEKHTPDPQYILPI